MPETTSQLTIITPLSGQLDADGFHARCELPDGTEVGLAPRTFGAIAITTGPASGWTGWADEWMFDDGSLAIGAYLVYVSHGPRAELHGWRRHVSAGKPTVHRTTCDVCAAVLERVGEAPYPACDHGIDGSTP